MNRISPKKLLNSKWTATNPVNGEKHFLVVKVEFDDRGAVERCVVEAVLTKRTTAIDWKELQDDEKWIQGWT